MGPETVSSKETMIDNFFMKWITMIYKKEVDRQALVNLIIHAQIVTKESYQELLEIAYKNMQHDFTEFLI